MEIPKELIGYDIYSVVITYYSLEVDNPRANLKKKHYYVFEKSHDLADEKARTKFKRDFIGNKLDSTSTIKEDSLEDCLF